MWPKPWQQGTFTWKIPWSFFVGDGLEKVFGPTVDEVFTLDATGTMSASKGGCPVIGPISLNSMDSHWSASDIEPALP